MRLLKLKIENINSLAGVYEIDFTARDFSESGIFAIVGPTGSGKTTILDAVTLALFGDTPRTKARTSTSKDGSCMVLTEGRKTCSATVVFESKGAYWRSRWSVILKRTGEPRPADVELVRLTGPDDEEGEIVVEQKSAWNTAVPEVIGMNFETFTRCALLAQGAFAELLRAKVDDRAAILERITGTEIYSAIGKKVFERARDEADGVKTLLARIEGTQVLEDDDRAALEKRVEEASAAAESAKKTRDELQADLAWVRQLAAARRRAEAARSALVKAERDEADAQVFKFEAAAARRAAEPLAERRKFLENEVSEKTHREAAECLKTACVEAQEFEKAASAAAQKAAEAAKQSQELEAQKAPEFERMDEFDRKVAAADAAAKAAAETEQASKVRRNHAASLAAKAAEKKASADAELQMTLAKLKACEADRELPTLMPTVRAAVEQFEKAAEQKAKMDAGRGRGDKKVADDKAALEAAEKALALAKAAAEAAELKLADAEHLRQTAYQGSSLESKLAQMRRFTGRAWAALWFLECGALLEAAGTLPAGEGAERIRGALSNRMTKLKNAYPEELGSACTLEAARSYRKALDEIELWSKSAEAADRGLAAAREEAKTAGRNLQAAQVKASEAEKEFNSTKLNMEVMLAKQQAADERAAAARADLLKAVRPCLPADANPEAVLADPKVFLEALETRSRAFAEAESAEAAAQKTASEVEAAHREAAAQLKLAEQTHAEAREASSKAKAAADAALKARRADFGDRSAKDERRALALQVRKDREAEQHAAKALAEAQNKVKTLQSRQAAEAKSADEFAKLAEASRARFAKLLAVANFPDESALLAAERPLERIEALERSVESAVKALAAAKSADEAAKSALAELMKSPRRDIPEAEVLQEAGAADKASAQAEQTLGELGQQLRTDDEARTRLKAVEEELKTAQAISAKWAKLSGLIGDATGKNFRLAAQRLTFALLLHEANVILSRMQSRYQLVPSGVQGLDLAVRDMELAGLERTSFNLSGGETFLVSLALALALSRVSSSRMQVDTLFLDEGFGTLDAETLEKALNALEMLQQKTGKLIGIISHVRAVRERVGVHITVRPRGASGESEVSGPGVRLLER